MVRPHLLDLKPYSSARDDFQGQASVYLDANENPLGSVPTGNFNRYPDPHQVELKNALAKLKGVIQDQIFLGNGSDEPIDLLIRAFCEPGVDEVIILPPTYGMYKVSAAINNVEIREVPLNPSFQLDVPAILENIGDHTKLIFVCSPNNPSGNLMRVEDVLKIAQQFDGLVIIDEAYIDFAASESLINKMDQYPNLVILQTFSKAWGLAAIRLGVTYSNAEVISILNQIKPPYNIDYATQEAGLLALQSKTKKDEFVEDILSEKKRLLSELINFPQVVEILPSDANFLLVRFQDAQKINAYLRSQGIIVRDRSKELNCAECLRITVGTAIENNSLLESLRRYS